MRRRGRINFHPGVLVRAYVENTRKMMVEKGEV